MSWLRAEMLLVDGGRIVIGFAANWLVQSTALIAVGLIVGRLIRRRGSAAQSAVYRMTLLAALACPLASCGLALVGVSGWSLEMPAAWTYVQLREPPPVDELHAAEAASAKAEVEAGRLMSARPSEPIPGSARANGPSAAEASRGATSDGLPPSGTPAKAEFPANEGERALAAKAFTYRAGLATFTVHRFGAIAVFSSLLWLAISGWLLARLIIAWSRLAELRQGAVVAETCTMRVCYEIAARLKLSPPEVLRSPCFPSPCLTGLMRPAVLLPDAEMDLPIRDVLLHELAHLRRHDCHWNLLSQLAVAMFFYQPLLWWLTRRLEATAEEVCDDYVVEFGGDREEYAHRLVDIAELSCGAYSPAGVGMVSLRSMLARRVVRILDRSRSLSTKIGGLLLSLVVAGGIIGTIAVGLVGIGEQQGVGAIEVPPSGDSTKTPATQGMKATHAKVDAKDSAAAPAQDKARSGPAPTNELAGRVVGANGRPVAGAKLYWYRTRVHDIEPLAPRLVATTDADGKYKFALPLESVVGEDQPANWTYQQEIAVVAEGHGFLRTSPGEIRAEAPPNTLLGVLAQAFLGDAHATIRLPAAGESIRGRLMNIDGQPIAGASVRIRWFDDIDLKQIRRRNPAQEGDKAGAWRGAVSDLLDVIEPVQLRDLLPMATTDASGQFELRNVGANRLVQLLVQGEGIESTDLVVRNQAGEAIVIEPDRHSDEAVAYKVHPREFMQAIGPSKPVAGRVLDFDTGQPIAGAIVRAYLIEGSRLHSSREREEFATRTDSDGRYKISGLPIGKGNQLVALTMGDVPYIPVGHPIDTSKPGSIQQDFRLKQGVWAEGRVFDAATNEPFTGSINYYRFRNRPLEKAIPGLFHAYVDGAYWTNGKGEYRVPVAPTRGILAFNYSGRGGGHEGIARFRRGYGADMIDGAEMMGSVKAFPTLPHYLTPTNYERVAEVDPKSGEKSVRVDMPLVASNPVAVRVIDGEGKPVKGCEVYGANERWGWELKEGSEFELQDLGSGERRKVFVFHRGRNLAGGTIVKAETKQVVEIHLVQAGSLSGRLIGDDGEPINDASLFIDYEKFETDDSAGIWADGAELFANPTTIPVDKEGRFILTGLIPGWTYNAHASAPRNNNGELMDRIIGDPIQGVRVSPGEKKDLGDVVVREGEAEASEPAAKGAAEASKSTENLARVMGRVVDANGQAAVAAHVAAVGWRTQPARGGDLDPRGEVLAEGTTDSNGHFQLSFAGVSAKTHRYAALLARKEGAAVAWQTLNLDAKETEVSLKITPEEPIRGRLIDIEGLPAAEVRLSVRGIMLAGSNKEGAGFKGNNPPRAWLATTLTDKQGNFTIRGVPAGHGVFLETDGSERFAPQEIALNTGMAEQRGERDATYRALVRNIKPGEEAVMALAPAQPFEGVVRFEDTGEPAAHARLTIWASQQPMGGSMVSVAGQADARGRYHISPRPGIRFGVTAYPPDGAPYLVRKTVEEIRWSAGDRVKQVDLKLPRGVLIQGKVVEAKTGKPVAGASVQYVPETINNPHADDDILTGWQGIQVADAEGRFQIVVLPGPGRLLAHSTRGGYVLQEIGERQLSQGKAGGRRNYAHAIHALNPKADAKSLDVTMELEPGATVAGQIVDERGESVPEAIVISRLIVDPLSLWWRGHLPPVLGGRYELTGLRQGIEYPTYFLDAKRRLGATAILRVGDAEPKVTLKPCGSAVFRLVDNKRRPVAGYTPTVEMVVTPGPYRYDAPRPEADLLAADADFLGNIDHTNYPSILETDEEGKATLPALVPGANYRIVVRKQGKWRIAKEFQVQAGERLDLGDIEVERGE